MKIFLAFLNVSILLFFPVLASSTDGSLDAELESIHFLKERNGKEVIQFQLSGNITPKVFDLPGEKPRVVFDFIETRYPAKEKRIIKAGGKLVKRIRVGLHNKPVAKTRVVIDLASSADYVIKKEYIPLSQVLEVQVYSKTLPDDEGMISVTRQKKDKEKAAKREEEIKKVEKTQTDTGRVEHVVKQVENKDVTKSSKTSGVGKAEETTHTEPEQILEQNLGLQGKTLGGTAKTPVVKTEIPVLVDVSYEKTTNNKEMVLFKLSGFHPPVVFAIEEEEPRIVCDFLDASLGKDIKNGLNSKGEYIRKVRVARHNNPDKVRVVLDLVAKNDYDLKQVFFKEDNLFVVVISLLQ